jgi:iron transport multicopper oxidase
VSCPLSDGCQRTDICRTYFNGITYIHQKVPSLFTAFSAPDPANPAIYGAVNPFVVNKGDIVQIVVNNIDGAIHPFHLHGHQFQVVERPKSGKGKYTGQGRNFPAVPSKRDTVQVNANSYAVIRFKADNPGVWLFHCHIEWHVVLGLTATIIEDPAALKGGVIPADHKAACAVQNIPTSGNAAGNTNNYTDLTGANTEPLFPDRG